MTDSENQLAYAALNALPHTNKIYRMAYDPESAEWIIEVYVRQTTIETVQEILDQLTYEQP